MVTFRAKFVSTRGLLATFAGAPVFQTRFENSSNAIRVTLSETPQTIDVIFKESDRFNASFVNLFIRGQDGTIVPGDYDGPTDIVPTRVAHVLETAGKTIGSNIIVRPIPSNYGLITWDGAKLTVS